VLVVVLLDEFAAPVDWHTVSASRSGSSTAPLLIIVTHNPNLAVVCDAEQVVCASLDKAANYRMEYLSGSNLTYVRAV